MGKVSSWDNYWFKRFKELLIVGKSLISDISESTLIFIDFIKERAAAKEEARAHK